MSTDPADWTYDAGVMIVEQKDGALVLSNNNGLWPDGTYTLDTPMTFDPKTSELYYDFTIQNGGKTSILFLIGNQYVKLNSHFAGVTISQNSGDIKGGGTAATGTLSCASLPIPESRYNDGHAVRHTDLRVRNGKSDHDLPRSAYHPRRKCTRLARLHTARA